MTDLTTNQQIERFYDNNESERDIVAGAISIYTGSLLNSDASGNVLLASDAASEIFAGVSLQEKVLTSANVSAGDNVVRVHPAGSGVLVRMNLASVTKADIGKTVYVADSGAVSLSKGTNAVPVGIVGEIDNDFADYCWIKLVAFADASLTNSSILELSDTPSAFVADEYLVTNAGGTALESSAISILLLSDTPAAFSASDTWKTNAGADAVEQVTV